ncbi:hypothetical protein PN492_14355, partial [Dolichospermum circinale CS-537/01]|nr:hypothetical protein [Dolichospermum circinale CS-537/01]
MQITISPHLQSTYKLIQCAFPKGIEPQNYLPLLALLSEEMSDRNLAEVVAYYSGKDYSVVLNRHLRKKTKLWYNRIKSCIYPEIMSNIVEYIHNNPEESQRLLGLHY